MVKKLGDSEHQTMLVAMYEGTEKLLNRKVSDFAVMQYFEDLKFAAEDLRKARDVWRKLPQFSSAAFAKH